MKFTIRDLLLVTVIVLVSGCSQGPGVYIPPPPVPTLESSLVGKWTCVSEPSIQFEFLPNKVVATDSTQNLEQVYDCEFTSSLVVISNASGLASLGVNVVDEQEIVIEFSDGKKHFKRQRSVPTSQAPAAHPPKP